MADEGNIANREEAEKCRDIAKECMKRGDFTKAEKFFEKSLRLFPLPGVRALKEKVIQMQSSGENTSSAKSASSPPPSSSSRKSEESSSSRNYTPEQEEGSKKILRSSKSSHYEVLGVSKDATEAEIRKSYRKLALRFHPDKNSAPSAEGAFKAISAAFTCLSDSSKREIYDQTGHDTDGPSPSHGGGFGGGGGHPFHNMQQVDPEELYRMFFQSFGGPGFHASFGGPGVRGQRFGRGAHTHEQQEDRRRQQQPASQAFQLAQLLPIIFVLLMSFSAFSPSSQPPMFSLNRQGVYQVPKQTAFVQPPINFFVNDQFDRSYRPFSDALRRVEAEVDREFKSLLSVKCKNERVNKNNRQYQARFSGTEARKKAEELPLPSCEEFTKRYTQRFSS